MPTVAPGSRIASPLLAWSSPAMIFSNDDLPVPFGPTTPIFAPCRNERVTLSRTTLSPWALRTLRRVNTYSAMVPEPSWPEGRGPDRGEQPQAAGAATSSRGPAPGALGDWSSRGARVNWLVP